MPTEPITPHLEALALADARLRAEVGLAADAAAAAARQHAEAINGALGRERAALARVAALRGALWGVCPAGAVDVAEKFDGDLQWAINQNISLENAPATLYLRPGTFERSKQIAWKDAAGKFGAYAIVQGAGPGRTVLRLPPGTPGFQDASKPVPFVYMASEPRDGMSPEGRKAGNGGAGFCNSIYDLTVDSRGSPGAIPISFLANNKGGMRRVEALADAAAPCCLETRPNCGPAVLSQVVTRGAKLAARLGALDYHLTLVDCDFGGIVRNSGILSVARCKGTIEDVGDGRTFHAPADWPTFPEPDVLAVDRTMRGDEKFIVNGGNGQLYRLNSPGQIHALPPGEPRIHHAGGPLLLQDVQIGSGLAYLGAPGVESFWDNVYGVDAGMVLRDGCRLWAQQLDLESSREGKGGGGNPADPLILSDGAEVNVCGVKWEGARPWGKLKGGKLRIHGGAFLVNVPCGGVPIDLEGCDANIRFVVNVHKEAAQHVPDVFVKADGKPVVVIPKKAGRYLVEYVTP